jgi:ABC-type multidrug transport system ATPase subunit
MAALEIRRLRKTFGTLVAVDDVSFMLEPGTLVGLLGPNGAGKTTTVSMLVGLAGRARDAVKTFPTIVLLGFAAVFSVIAALRFRWDEA